jgi:hypothetical protein
MTMPKLEVEDLLIVPEQQVDIEIWMNEFLIKIEEEQPLFFNYLKEVIKRYGRHAGCTAVMVYRMIEHALDRDY